ncbi:hypothetical protein PAI11_24170 [Patulibacter medicamentivorans]|uniref:Uncharacterized protein n=1 Tax=Patulibacter medicamentivorans TaxID=1097667 RepID=H0E6G7_9ACTN|nr:hypothetical protein PAI11_24170 [Patulibacter medicamentivorans]
MVGAPSRRQNTSASPVTGRFRRGCPDAAPAHPPDAGRIGRRRRRRLRPARRRDRRRGSRSEPLPRSSPRAGAGDRHRQRLRRLVVDRGAERHDRPPDPGRRPRGRTDVGPAARGGPAGPRRADRRAALRAAVPLRAVVRRPARLARQRGRRPRQLPDAGPPRGPPPGDDRGPQRPARRRALLGDGHRRARPVDPALLLERRLPRLRPSDGLRGDRRAVAAGSRPGDRQRRPDRSRPPDRGLAGAGPAAAARRAAAGDPRQPRPAPGGRLLDRRGLLARAGLPGTASGRRDAALGGPARSRAGDRRPRLGRSRQRRRTARPGRPAGLAGPAAADAPGRGPRPAGGLPPPAADRPGRARGPRRPGGAGRAGALPAGAAGAPRPHPRQRAPQPPDHRRTAAVPGERGDQGVPGRLRPAAGPRGRDHADLPPARQRLDPALDGDQRTSGLGIAAVDHAR